jgi:hypothetical protein
MGVTTEFIGSLVTSRPLTPNELKEYAHEQNKDNDMYLTFLDGSNNEIQGPEDNKIAGYMDMEEGFMKTFHWMKSKGIKLSGRISYASDYILSDVIGDGFGAFVATPENVTYHKLDFDGLKMVSNVIYSV